MNENNSRFYELSGTSPEFRTQLTKQPEELASEAIAYGKVDVMKLKEFLQEDARDTNEQFGLFWTGKKREAIIGKLTLFFERFFDISNHKL